ncbi:TolC family protein [Sulfurimonas sp. SWIR-19]|uniref:TolC family protein n=1 Tax=Sulfurimonas sp. SWIR-19 TaxID=2878390 RepID=UPI001CF4BE15|nr:TolC family protein [Sulfurimonas sp. SWIR-19]UCN01241.1 TolC family protein [Sulfurimonas sp. SWIR-19]
MKASVLLTLLCLSCSFPLFGADDNADLEKFISSYKQLQFQYDYEKNEAESSRLRDSWIVPVQINYSYSKNNAFGVGQSNQNAAIRINQPIFQSGGIYYGIKFANASKYYTKYSIDVAKRKMIKDTIAVLMQIKQTEFKEQKQKLQIKNSEINLEQKKEEYFSGQLDSGFLDDAVIQKNTALSVLYDIQAAKEKLVSSFHALSDLDYTKVAIPRLELLQHDEFLQHNIVLQMDKAQTEKNRYNKNVTLAKYLPKVNLTAGYNWKLTTNQAFQVGPTIVSNSNELNYYDYGIAISIPLDINTFRDIESAKVDYLKAKIVLKDKQRELNSLYEQVMHNIENYNKKIALSNENIILYTKLLEDTKKLFKAGYKTKYDVQRLANSLQIQNIDTKIYELDKQLELLNLYEMYISNEK